MKKYILGLTLLAAGLGACSDEWDKHYEVQEQGDGSLWQVISSQPELSNFARLLQATDFDRSLNGAQVFTVFAPTNDVFSQQLCDSLIEAYQTQVAQGYTKKYNSVLQEYVKNYIALYNYTVSPYSHDSIVMMNGKYKVLDTDDLSGVKFVQSNRVCNNGVLFTVEKRLDYLPNIYEYYKKDPELDSVARFYAAYEYIKFSEAQSVPGGIEDGKTVYLDSVTYLSSMMFDLVELNDEDSTFMAIAPTNEVWRKELEKHAPHFVYDKTVVGRDSLSYLYPRLQIMDAAYYSVTNNPAARRDERMISTFSHMKAVTYKYRYKRPAEGYYYYWEQPDLGVPSVQDYLFEGTEPVQCSNGTVYKQRHEWNSTLANYWKSNATIIQEGEYTLTTDSVNSKTTRPFARVYPSKDNPYYSQIGGDGWVEISPTAAEQTQAMFSVYNVLSNVTYDVYVVTVPPQAYDIYAEPKKNNFRATLLWNDMEGKQQKRIRPGISNSQYFTASADEVSYIHIDTITFPTSSFGLEKAQVKIQIDGFTQPSLVRKGTHSYTLRIDRFLLIPRTEDNN